MDAPEARLRYYLYTRSRVSPEAIAAVRRTPRGRRHTQPEWQACSLSAAPHSRRSALTQLLARPLARTPQVLCDVLPPSAALDDATSAFAGERHADTLWALSGAAKAFALQVAEEAVAVAAAAGHVGPLTQDHIVEAHRRIALRGGVVGIAPASVIGGAPLTGAAKRASEPARRGS